MATPVTVPVIGPDGRAYDVPQENAAEAIKNGGTLATDIVGPDNVTYAVPLERVKDALKAGGRLATSPPSLPQPVMQESALGKVQSGSDAIRNADVAALKGVGGFLSGAGGATIDTVNQVTKPIEYAYQHTVGSGQPTQGLIHRAVGDKQYSALTDERNTAEKVGGVAENIGEFILGDEALKGMSFGEKLGLTQKVVKLAESHPYIASLLRAGMNAVRAGTAGTIQGVVHGEDAGDAVEQGAAIGAGSAALEGIGATYKAVKGALPAILKGADSVQPEVASTLRNAVRGAAEDAGTATSESLGKIASEPIVNSSNGASTILDDHISALQKQTKAAYRAVDDAVGFDLKAEKKALANDQYKLSQLGNTDADVTARERLIQSINDSTDRIAEAESALKDAGINPRAADALNKRLQATKLLKQKLISRYNPATNSFNVDGLLNDVKNMRLGNKYGDRVAQALGSTEAADALASQLETLQQRGIKAVKTQQLAKFVAKYVGIGAGLTGAAKLGMSALGGHSMFRGSQSE